MTRLGLMLLGVAMGLAGAALHQSWPWLVVTGVAGTAVLVAAGPPQRIWWSGGFAAPPLALSWPRGEGDLVLTGTGSLLLACFAALWLGASLAGLLPQPSRPRS